MHIVISWDIHVENPEWEEINSLFRACLKSFSWVKPLNNFYIVKLKEDDDRDVVKDRMTKVCKDNPKKANFVVSPIMYGGRYNGWLPHDMWDKIRVRSDEDDTNE